MKYSDKDAEELMITLRKKSEELRQQENKVSFLATRLLEIKSRSDFERHEDGQPKLDKNGKKIPVKRKPIDEKLGTELTDERRDMIYTKIVEDSKNL